MRRKNIKKNIMVALVVIVIVLIAGMKVSEMIQKDPSVSSIRAEFVGKVAPGGTYSKEMFKVQGVTPDGRLVPLSDFSSDTTTAASNGGTCEIEITAQGCKAKTVVQITRNPVGTKNIGFPNEEDATVTIYDNGDLEFSGKGDIQNFGTSYPWDGYDYTHVYIGSNLSITNMDGWFTGNTKLVYCSQLPRTLKTMRATFKGCEMLENTPDYFQCTDLKIMDNAFDGCKSLTEIDVLPVSVVSAKYSFSGCALLQQPCDMSKTSSLNDITGIHSGCAGLRNAPDVPETVTVMDEAFQGCINIPYATKFPDKVQSIAGCYANCSNLSLGTAIPESAEDISKCFAGCASLTGSLEVNTDCDAYKGVLSGAVSMGDKLSISGNSGNLLAIQQDAQNKNIILADPEEAARQNTRMLAEKEAMKEGLY